VHQNNSLLFSTSSPPKSHWFWWQWSVVCVLQKNQSFRYNSNVFLCELILQLNQVRTTESYNNIIWVQMGGPGTCKQAASCDVIERKESAPEREYWPKVWDEDCLLDLFIFINFLRKGIGAWYLVLAAICRYVLLTRNQLLHQQHVGCLHGT
jgi:hypothetical protein